MRKQKTYWEIKNDVHTYFANLVKTCAVEKDYIEIVCYDEAKAQSIEFVLINAGLSFYRTGTNVIAWYDQQMAISKLFKLVLKP